MRVVVIGTRGFPNVQGGVEIHCQNLYPALAKLGCEVIVFTRKPYVNSNIKEYQSVKLVALPAVKNKYLEAFLHTFLGALKAKQYKPDVLHIQAIGPSFFCPLARILGMRVVVTSHGSNYKHLKWGRFSKLFLRFSEYLGVTFSNKVIAISNSIAQEIKNTYKIDATIIPNGVAIAEIQKSEDTLKRFGLEDGKYILAVGRFVPEKGFDDLIPAFAGMTEIASGQEPALAMTDSRLRGNDKWKLVIVGRTDHEDKYSLDLKKKAEGNKDIILTGFLTGGALQELYSHAGLFVLPSYYEGLPIALLEAMSYGLSCIASDIAANREVGLSEDRFFKAGDATALAEKLKEFIGKPFSGEERKKQIDFIADKYDWEKIADRTLEVYRAI